MTVLIVEDDEAYGYALSKALRAAGRNPIVCRSWTDYLERVETDLSARSAVLDVRLPQGTPNGMALARMTKIKRPGLKLIVVSNHPELLRDAPEGVQTFDKTVPLETIAAAAND